METQLSVFVTGVTGNQGHAVARHLLKQGALVTGLTRNANSGKARNLFSILGSGDVFRIFYIHVVDLNHEPDEFRAFLSARILFPQFHCLYWIFTDSL